MLQTPELVKAIDNLYTVFRRYELRKNTDPCTCHHVPEDEHRVHRAPLNNLSCEDLRDYAMDAIYTWGTGDDFKHFIPRIFELLAQTPGHFVDPASVFGRLTYESWCSISWRYWPEGEQTAIRNYFRTIWDAALDSDPDDLPFDGAYGWLQAIAQAEHDLAGYLDYWFNAPSANAHRNLALTVTQQGLPRTKSPNGYWAGHKEQWKQLNDWLRRPEVRQKLADAFERWADSPFAGELMDAAVFLPG